MLCLRLLVDALGNITLVSPACLKDERLAMLARDLSDPPAPGPSELEVLIDSLGPRVDESPMKPGFIESLFAPPARADTLFPLGSEGAE